MGDFYSFIKIENLDMPELAVYRLYNEIQLRKINEPNPGIFICESPKVIRRALEAGYEAVSVLTAIDKPEGDAKAVFDVISGKDAAKPYADSVSGEDAVTGLISGTTPIYLGDDSVLRELAGYALTDGVLAAMKRKEMPTLQSIIGDKKKIAILENIHNPTNIGAIFRSAAALGVEAVIITDDSTDPFYRRAERVSMGTVFQVPWTRLKKDEDYLSELSELGFKTVAMALSDEAVTINDSKIKEEEKLAIILGNEGYGLKDDTIKRSNYVAMIPMNPVVDSLNVAAASAIMFWELLH